MTTYHEAHRAVLTSQKAPVWDGKLLENVSAGSMLVSEDAGYTWRLAGVEDADVLDYGGFAMKMGRRGEVIKMTSRLSIGE